jgi:hypothetical protein
MKPAPSCLRPFRMIRLGLAFALAAVLHTAAQADAPSPLDQARASYQTKLEGLWEKHLGEEQAAAASNRYCKLLADCASAFRANGKLEGFLAVQNELKRYRATGKVEEDDMAVGHPQIERVQRAFLAARATNQRKLQESEASLARAYLQHLEKVKADLVRQNQIDQAVAVDQEIAAIRATLPQDVRAAPRAEPRAAPEPAPSGPPPLPAALRKPIPPDRLVVYATDANGPVAGLEVTLKSHTFNKSFTAKTDRDGLANFTILPELAYRIAILDPRYEPFIQPNCSGGDFHPAELQPLPDGVQAQSVPPVGEIRLPGISLMRISGSYAGSNGSGVMLTPTSPRTVFEGSPPDESPIRLGYDTWTTVAERSARVEMKVISIDDFQRTVLFRPLPPEPGAAPGQNESRLTVLATSQGRPVQGVEVALTSQADGSTQQRKTDRNGNAEFTIDPSPEYILHVADKRFEPFVKPHCIGGETHAVDLPPLPAGTTLLTLGRVGDIQLPGISPLRTVGYSYAGRSVQTTTLMATSPKTRLAGHPPGTERMAVNLDEWLTVSEGSKQVEFKILAPSANVRILLYRRIP